MSMNNNFEFFKQNKVKLLICFFDSFLRDSGIKTKLIDLENKIDKIKIFKFLPYMVNELSTVFIKTNGLRVPLYLQALPIKLNQ
ncbi:hypothetical protein BpHYR1_049826 [Brachionus plicatilis]|uniref:Uncharacterized protein n=1 Tax=Brachionus plicatilis TaxID=10195 RepID=A0A3M7SLC5_BRAPC|nr:hypothetical protein BpHYR1_049826 [Brachionus plicatilis]